MDLAESKPTQDRPEAGKAAVADLELSDTLYPPDLPATGVDAGIDLHELASRPTRKESLRPKREFVS